MKILKAIYIFLTSMYSKLQLLTLLSIIIFAFFISESNVFARLEYDSQIRDLNRQIDNYRDQAKEDKLKLEELEADKDQIEKFARENYLMKKPNEDIFIMD